MDVFLRQAGRKIVVIILMTAYRAGRYHPAIVVGSVEILYLVFNGALRYWSDFLWPFAPSYTCRE